MRLNTFLAMAVLFDCELWPRAGRTLVCLYLLVSVKISLRRNVVRAYMRLTFVTLKLYVVVETTTATITYYLLLSHRSDNTSIMIVVDR